MGGAGGCCSRAQGEQMMPGRGGLTGRALRPHGTHGLPQRSKCRPGSRPQGSLVPAGSGGTHNPGLRHWGSDERGRGVAGLNKHKLCDTEGGMMG